MEESQNRPKVTAIVFTLNEEESLPHVLPNVPDWIEEVLVVDGHSTDRTREVAKEIYPRCKVILQPGIGKGNALKYGVQKATGEIIVALDADGETDPTEINKFIEPLLAGYQFAKGSRLANNRPQRMPIYRWFGNKILAITFNILYGGQFTDICSGYNGFWKKDFESLELTYENCEMEQQMLVRAKKSGLKIAEVPHQSDGRISGESKVNGIKQGFVDWFVLIKERFYGSN